MIKIINNCMTQKMIFVVVKQIFIVRILTNVALKLKKFE